ncbi:hypothetical protein ECG_04008 [Echinococcus granulosus]|nr:hypothetical protein ECG_04008 [Echinococcus granulosus]
MTRLQPIPTKSIELISSLTNGPVGSLCLQLPNTLSVGSTLPTPQQTSHSSGPAPSNQTGSLEATPDKRQRLM